MESKREKTTCICLAPSLPPVLLSSLIEPARKSAPRRHNLALKYFAFLPPPPLLPAPRQSTGGERASERSLLSAASEVATRLRSFISDISAPLPSFPSLPPSAPKCISPFAVQRLAADSAAYRAFGNYRSSADVACSATIAKLANGGGGVFGARGRGTGPSNSAGPGGRGKGINCKGGRDRPGWPGPTENAPPFVNRSKP